MAQGAEPFDEFDQLYLKNHKEQITKLHSGESKESLGLEADKAEEIYQFWDMHRKQIADRLKDTVTEAKPYGAWVTPSGKMYMITTPQGHEDFAKNMIGKSIEAGEDASTALADRGWGRVVIQGGQLMLDLDGPLTSSMKSALKDYAIENELEAVRDTSMGLRPF